MGNEWKAKGRRVGRGLAKGRAGGGRGGACSRRECGTGRTCVRLVHVVARGDGGSETGSIWETQHGRPGHPSASIAVWMAIWHAWQSRTIQMVNAAAPSARPSPGPFLAPLLPKTIPSPSRLQHEQPGSPRPSNRVRLLFRCCVSTALTRLISRASLSHSDPSLPLAVPAYPSLPLLSQEHPSSCLCRSTSRTSDQRPPPTTTPGSIGQLPRSPLPPSRCHPVLLHAYPLHDRPIACFSKPLSPLPHGLLPTGLLLAPSVFPERH